MKNLKTFLILSLTSFLMVLCFKIAGRFISEKQQDQKISEICQVVAGEIQTGSYVRAIENAKTLFASKFSDATLVVQIKEGATVFGNGLPSSDEARFRQTSCQVQARSDLSVIFRTERDLIFDLSFIPTFAFCALAIWLLLILATITTRHLSLVAQRRFNLEIQKSLGLIADLPSRSTLGRWLENVVQGGTSGDNLKMSVQALREKIIEQQRDFASLREAQVRTELNLKKNEKFVEVVRQVRHDIRGPLQTLLVMMDEKSEKYFETRRLGAIVQSIQGMIEDLEIKEEIADSSRAGEVLHVAEALIKEVIQQKRILFGSVGIDFKINSEYLSVVRVQPLHFRRLIANLLQNAFEAMGEGTGMIQVLAEKKNDSLKITIQDSGIGIPDDVQPQLFKSGFTFGKENGSGLGLSHAKSCIVRWGGDIQIESQKNVGTKVLISLPLAEPTAKFVHKSPMSKADVNIVVDDEIESFSRLQTVLPGPSVYCSSLAEFEGWRSAFGDSEDVQFIFDYNLKEPKTGLEILRQLSSAHPRILATNDFDRPDVIEASRNGIYVLPKIFLV